MINKLRAIFRHELVQVLLIAAMTYCVFYARLIFTNSYISGSDPIYYHYPNRFFLWESLQHGVFPFYTERIFSGFPLYADITSGFLNPINILSIVLFGPFDSYKILHFVVYLVGSWGLYKFLKYYNGGLLGYFVSNLTYYFSFFSLYHLKHFDITPAVYLLPLALYALQKFMVTSKIRYVFLNALILAQALYFGSMQMVLIMLICSLSYCFVYLNKYLLLKYCVYFGLAFITLVMPLVVPAYDLYTLSMRGESGVSYLQGSFSPLMALNLIYPFTFGVGAQYKWEMVSKDFLIQETYVYVGIISFVLGFITLLKLNDPKLRKFVFVLLGIFLLLGFLGSMPFVRSLNLPLVSMFRYWGRSVILCVFVTSILAGLSFNYLSAKLVRTNFKILVIGLFCFAGLVVSDLLAQGYTQKIIGLAFNGAIVKDINLMVFIFLGVLCFGSLFLHRTNKFVLGFLVFLDLFFFSLSVVPPQLETLDKIKPNVNYAQYGNYTNNRVLIMDAAYTNNLNLYNNLYGILGYSQMKSANYYDLVTSLGFKNLEKYERSLDTNNKDTWSVLHEALGLTAIVAPNNIPLLQSISSIKAPFSMQSPTLKVSNIIYREGYVSANTTAMNDAFVQTYIRNYSGWNLYVDGAKVHPSSNSNDVFISFPISEGSHNLVLNYVPQGLYAGIRLSIIVGLALIIMIIFTHEQDRIHKNGRVRKDVLVAQR